MNERAAILVPLPLSVVESTIWDVTGWDVFLNDVEWIERSGHERFVFGIRHGRRVREVQVAVAWHPREHQVTWQELGGGGWEGEIRLTALNGRRTRLGVETTGRSRPLADALVRAVGGRRRSAIDLGPLAERFARIPQPFNPSRLEQAAQRASHGTLRPAHASDFLSRRPAGEPVADAETDAVADAVADVVRGTVGAV